MTFKLTKKTEMNVYVYEGKSREGAKGSLVEENKQVEVGESYEVAAESGILIVAFPNNGKTNTEFGFEYWVKVVKKDVDPVEEEGFDMVNLLYIGIALFFLIVIAIVVYKFYRK